MNIFVGVFMEESEEVHSSFSAIGPRGYYKVWLSENNANDAEVRHFVLNDILPAEHAPNLGCPPLPAEISPHNFLFYLAEQEGAIFHSNSAIIL